jgi:hypothetical protein
MGDRIHAIGGLVAMPIAVGIVIGTVLHHIGMSDVVCAIAGTAIAVPGAIVIYALLMRYWRKQDDEK